MLLFVFAGVLFKFSENRPDSVPLFQLPPAIAPRALTTLCLLDDELLQRFYLPEVILASRSCIQRRLLSGIRAGFSHHLLRVLSVLDKKGNVALFHRVEL